MNTQQLLYFITTAQTRSVRQAARFCGVSPATISVVLQQLSDELQTSLSKKSSGAFELTAEGVLFYEAAQEILTLIDSSRCHFYASQFHLAGQLHLAAIAGIFPFVLSPFLTTVMMECSQLILTFQSLTAEDILQQVSAQKIDLGYLHLTEKDEAIYAQKHPDLIFERFITYDFVFMAHKNHPLAKKKKRSIGSVFLKNYPLILYVHEAVADNPLLTAFSTQSTQKVYFTQNTNYLAHMVNEQDYLTLIPYINQRLPTQFFDIRSQVIFFPQKPLCYHTGFVYAAQTAEQTLLQNFIAFARHFYHC